MNNYRYIAIQKAASWEGNAPMIAACVAEFHSIKDADTMDTKAAAIGAAAADGISPAIVNAFITIERGTISRGAYDAITCGHERVFDNGYTACHVVERENLLQTYCEGDHAVLHFADSLGLAEAKQDHLNYFNEQ